MLIRRRIFLVRDTIPHCDQVSLLTPERDESGHAKPVDAVFLTEPIQHAALHTTGKPDIDENDERKKHKKKIV